MLTKIFYIFRDSGLLLFLGGRVNFFVIFDYCYFILNIWYNDFYKEFVIIIDEIFIDSIC